MPLTSELLPAPLTPVTAVSTPSGMRTSIPRRLCSRAFFTVIHARGSRRVCGVSMRRLPDRYCPVRLSLFASASGDPSKVTRAAEVAGAGAEVDDVVGRADRLLVVLDHDDAVAEVAKPAKRLDEARVVARVQADARLVEHVHDARELAPELAREPDPLRLAAAQSSGRRGRASGSRARRRAGSGGGSPISRSAPSLMAGARRRSASSKWPGRRRPSSPSPRRSPRRPPRPRGSPGGRRLPPQASHGARAGNAPYEVARACPRTSRGTVARGRG